MLYHSRKKDKHIDMVVIPFFSQGGAQQCWKNDSKGALKIFLFYFLDKLKQINFTYAHQ